MQAPFYVCIALTLFAANIDRWNGDLVDDPADIL